MPGAHKRNRAISETRDRFWGRIGPAPSSWAPPGNGSQLGCVFGRCAAVLVVSVCLFTVIMSVRLVWSLSGCFFWRLERAGEALGHSRSEVLCCLLLLVLLACVGRFPGREEPLAPSVSRSPPRHLRTTGRPMGPATPHTQTKFSRTNCLGFVWFLLGFWLVSDNCSDFWEKNLSCLYLGPLSSGHCKVVLGLGVLGLPRGWVRCPNDLFF